MKFIKKYILFLALILGFIIRLAVVVNNGPGPSYDSPAATDEVNYRELARNIFENKIYGSWSEGFFTRSVRAPIYPAILSLANFAAGRWAPLALNLACDTFNIFLIYLLALLLFGSGAALVSSFLYALFAPSFIYLRFSTPEIFALTLILLLLISMCKYEKIASPYLLSVVIFYSLLIHTRPSFLPLLLVLPLILFLKFRNFRDIKKRPLLSLLPCFLIFISCLPWIARNYRIHKTLVPVIVLPAWHTMSSVNTEISLDIEKTLDIIYAPKHEGWTEGQYFIYGRNTSWELLKKHHIKIVVFGAYRILKSWCFPDFYQRIYHPKAYFNPVPIYKDRAIFLPDFEGIMYLSFFILLFAIFANRSKSIKNLTIFILNNLWLIIFVFAYLGVHIVAIPFPQYRFLVEPVILTLLTGLALSLLSSAGEPLSEKERKTPHTGFVNLTGLFLFLAIIIPLIIPFRNDTIIYRSEMESEGLLTYDELRKLQWQNRGFVPENTKAVLYGRVRYIAAGCEFVGSGCSPAKRAENSYAGIMYVEENSTESPLGKGDVRLNFKSSKIPDDNDYIVCIGTMSTGIFRDLIMNVEKWQPINEKQ